MSDQPDLFDVYRNAVARNSDPQTSHQAAAEMRGERANKLERVALIAIGISSCGLTNHELVEKTGYSWNTITPRIRPLVRKGFVVDSGLRRRGPTNKWCIVWKLAEPSTIKILTPGIVSEDVSERHASDHQ